MVKSENGQVTLDGELSTIAGEVATELVAIHHYEAENGLDDAKFREAEARFYMSAAFIAFYGDDMDKEKLNSKHGQEQMMDACSILIKSLVSVYGKGKADGGK